MPRVRRTAWGVAGMVSGGEVVARILAAHGVRDAFGVISIHNIPILDAFHRLGQVRFYAARSESGAANMADGYARTRGGLGVVVTSTGPGAGNAAGAMTEALSAGTPLLHLTGQIDARDVDQGRGMNHETPRQLEMLAAVSKAAFRVRHAQSLPAVITQAIQTALAAPTGPVSVEIPIDIQTLPMPLPGHLPVLPRPMPARDAQALDLAVETLKTARRPMLWLGGGARGCTDAVRQLMALGFGVVTSIHGRTIVDEADPQSLGTLNNLDATQGFFDTCDGMLVVGSRLRGNETRLHQFRLPRPLIQVDADIAAWSRNYEADLFVLGDSRSMLDELAERLAGARTPDPAFLRDLARAKADAHSAMLATVGPYAGISRALREAMPADAVFVRDVTISANTWAHRLFPIAEGAVSIHALGGGIGQGLQQGIGAAAAAAADGRQVFVLCGDGGLALNAGEFATAVQEGLALTVILMNDGGYGVMRNIQDASYAGRHFYSDLAAPDWQAYAQVMGISAWRARSVDEFAAALSAARSSAGGVRLIEVDMDAIGPFPVPFAGPRLK